MNKDLRIGRKFLCLVIALVMVMTLIPRLPASLAYAAVGDEPEHAKILQVNEDGTYKLALNVKGDSEKKVQHVNVIVIVDRSGSMNEQSGTGAYVATNSTGTGLYGFVDGEYVPLTRQGGSGNRTFWYNGVQYTGQRYQYDYTATRLQATQAAVNGLANNLLSYNGKDDNPDDVVEMALVSFSTNARTDVAETTSPGTYTDAVNALTQGGGTNWEAALSQANGINFGDSDPTYVIFFSDGAPTFHATDGGYGNWNQQYGVYGSGGETEPNMERSYNQATDDAATLATKVGVNNFYTIFAYGTATGSTYMTNLTAAAGAPSGNNYSASNTAELNDAFDEILESIEMAGIGNVDMTDGTTSNVATSTGTAHLLDVDDSTFKYYRAGGDNGEGGEKYNTNANTIKNSDTGETVGIGEEWTGEGVPPAVFNDATGAVEWDLGDNFILENDVTYTVTFDCWPSQDTLDLVADIRNDPSVYDGLDPEIKKYLDANGNLKTNTTTSITWTDTRPGGGDGESEFNTVEPVTTTAVEQLAVTKKWENALDGQEAEALDLTVTRDGEDKYDVLLSSDNDWTDNVFISTGIMRTNGDEVELLTSGHDFTFTEPADLGYYWELEVPVVRPMIINGGTPKTLIRVDENHPGEGYTHYTLPDYQVDEDTVIPGGDYYLDEAAGVGLTATNHRRARLNLTKVVDGEDANPDQEFEFTLNVVDSKASEGSESDLNSDYWIWFSVWNGEYIDALVSGAEKEMDDETGEWTGFYYAPSGSDIVVNLKAGDNLRVINLPTDSTYTFTEGTLPQNYTFTSSELGAKTWDEEGQEVVVDPEEADPTFSGAQTTTGTIEATNMDYTVTYTNTYAKTDVEITKVWDDADDQDGKRPTTEGFKSWLKLLADGTDVTSANANKLTVTEGEDEEGNTIYTAKWTGLDRYSGGEEIEYTVTETPSADYEADVTTVEDHGTITNSHETEVTSIDVQKIWEGPAGNEVTVTLYADNAATDKTLALNAGNQWKGTFANLPVYAGGVEIEYSVVEAGVSGVDATKYTTTITGDAETGFTITNTNTETVDVTATKVWDDANDQDGKRPETLTLTLNSAPAQTTVPAPTVTGTDGNSWTYSWTGLPKYAADGTEYTYTISEDQVPEGYTKTPSNPVASGGTITNSYTPEVTSASITKSWDDANNQDGIRPTSIVMTLSNGQTVPLNAQNNWTATVTGLPKYADGVEIVYTWTETEVPEGYTCATPTVAAGGTITNTHTPEQTKATVKKVWVDADDQDGKRPDDLTVTLKANGETSTSVVLSESNNWTATVEGLAKYAAGAEIEYTWDEGTITDYTLTSTESDPTDATLTILTNTHTPEQVVVDVEKVWEDANNQDGKRPGSVTVKLLADEVDTGKTLELNAGNQWKGSFTGLDKYADGEEIEYTVEEVAVPEGYDVTVTPANEEGGDATGDAAGGETGDTTGDDAAAEGPEAIGYIVTNVHEPEVVKIPVTKVWNDADDQDGFRPKNGVTVSLLADGEETGKTVSLTENNQWKNTFEGDDLYKYAVGKEGVEVVYTIKELEVAEYKVAITGTAAAGFTVTNTHTPEVVEVSVEKVWDDADDRDGIRPDSVSVTLFADGDDVTQEGIEATVVLDESNSWKYTWTGLNKRAAGQEISYTVEEDPVPEGYQAETTGDAKKGFTIKNFHLANPEPVTIDPPVKKVVKGNPPKDETFTFQMKALTEGAPMPDGAKDGVLTMDIVGAGEKEFGVAEIKEAGTYKYEITEIDSKAENYTYDTTVYTLTVEVEEVADGTQVKLVKTETIEGGDGQIVFTNTYEEPPAKTGDTTIVTPYIVIGVASLILLIMLLFRKKRTN